MKPGCQHLLIAVFLWSAFFSTRSHAQFFSTGNDPFSSRWYELKGSDYRMIFPSDDTLRWKNKAAYFNRILPATGSSLSFLPHKTTIIIHSNSVISNGYSIMAPYRVELYPRSPVRMMAQPYENQLFIHEMRHMAQMQKMSKGSVSFLYPLLGQSAAAVAFGLHVPGWFAEGDAVLTETLLSRSGRGRTPWFSRHLRAVALRDSAWSFDKAMFGSYKDYVPDEYVIGYHMVSMGRLLYGRDLWDIALNNINKHPFRIANFSRFIQQETGYTKRALYEKMMDWTGGYWRNEFIPSNLKVTFHPVKKDDYTNYFRPHPLRSGEWLVYRRSMSDIPSFVTLDGQGNETILFYPGLIDDGSYSYANGLISWAEERPDIRWENRSYSEIWIWSLKEETRKRLTHLTRYYQPKFSPAADKLAVVEKGVDGSSHIHIISSENGQILSILDAPVGSQFNDPVWDDGGQNLVAIMVGDGGKSLIGWAPGANEFKIIYTFGFKEVTNLNILNGEIFFTGPVGSSEGIYRMDGKGEHLELIGTTEFGVSYMVSADSCLHVSVYTPKGFRPGTIDLKSVESKAVAKVSDLDDPITPLLTRYPNEYPVTDWGQSDKQVEIKPYSRIKRTFHFHSWAPVYIDPERYQIEPGVVFMSQNELNTMIFWGGYQYNRSLARHFLVADVRFSRLFPRIDLSYRGTPFIYQDDADNWHMDPTRWRHWLQASVTVPLNLSSGIWNRFLEFQTGVNLEQYIEVINNQIVAEQLWFPSASVVWSTTRLLGVRDLFPRWGMSGSLISVLKPNEHQIFVNPNVVLMAPGLGRNHSFRVGYKAYLGSGLKNIPLATWDLPRGLVDPSLIFRHLVKVDYALPLLYPDASLGSIIYIKRVKANLFADYGMGPSMNHHQLTWGIDLSANFHLFRVGAELDAGARIIRINGLNRLRIEPLIAFSMN